MTSTALRQACPPGTCDCDRDALLDSPDADARILRLTLHEEKRLLARLESISTLSELEHLQQRMHEQLGIRLMIGPGLKEVRSLRGIGMQFEPQRGLCRNAASAAKPENRSRRRYGEACRHTQKSCLISSTVRICCAMPKRSQ